MLPSKEELAQRYTTFSNQKLLDIVYKMEARPEALEAAKEELKSRNVPIEIVNEFYDNKEEMQVIANENALIPLPLHQKFLFYFAWFIPFFFGNAFQLNYKEDGMFRKLKQTKWYSTAGFIALILTTIISLTFELGNIPAFTILFGGFIIFYLIETRLNN